VETVGSLPEFGLWAWDKLKEKRAGGTTRPCFQALTAQIIMIIIYFISDIINKFCYLIFINDKVPHCSNL
jgi:hypothetical protein